MNLLKALQHIAETDEGGALLQSAGSNLAAAAKAEKAAPGTGIKVFKKNVLADMGATTVKGAAINVFLTALLNHHIG